MSSQYVNHEYYKYIHDYIIAIKLELGHHQDYHSYLFGELWSLYLDEVDLYGFEIAVMGAECHSAGPNRVLVLVRVNASIDHITKQLVHGVSEPVSVEHAVERSHEHCLAHVKLLRGPHN